MDSDSIKSFKFKRQLYYVNLRGDLFDVNMKLLMLSNINDFYNTTDIKNNPVRINVKKQVALAFVPNSNNFTIVKRREWSQTNDYRSLYWCEKKKKISTPPRKELHLTTQI